MGKIVAIGGGEIGRPGHKIETLSIDKAIIKLSSKKHPRLLFLPTASDDSQDYVKVVNKYFGKKLGCKVNSLLLSTNPSKTEIKNNILNADIIYVGGGNTKNMMRRWKKHGVDKMLELAYKKDIVLAGVSAGAICWFKFGSSDSHRLSGHKNKSYIRVKGLGLIKALASPHHIREKDRMSWLKSIIKKYGGIGLAMDDYSALLIDGKKRAILKSNQTSSIKKVYKRQGKLIVEQLNDRILQTIVTT